MDIAILSIFVLVFILRIVFRERLKVNEDLFMRRFNMFIVIVGILSFTYKIFFTH